MICLGWKDGRNCWFSFVIKFKHEILVFMLFHVDVALQEKWIETKGNFAFNFHFSQRKPHKVTRKYTWMRFTCFVLSDNLRFEEVSSTFIFFSFKERAWEGDEKELKMRVTRWWQMKGNLSFWSSPSNWPHNSQLHSAVPKSYGMLCIFVVGIVRLATTFALSHMPFTSTTCQCQCQDLHVCSKLWTLLVV